MYNVIYIFHFYTSTSSSQMVWGRYTVCLMSYPCTHWNLAANNLALYSCQDLRLCLTCSQAEAFILQYKTINHWRNSRQFDSRHDTARWRPCGASLIIDCVHLMQLLYCHGIHIPWLHLTRCSAHTHNMFQYRAHYYFIYILDHARGVVNDIGEVI